MSLDPADTRRQDANGASVISFTERRASRDAAQAQAAVQSAPAQAARARIAAVTDTCWCCRSKVRAVVGVIVEPAMTGDGSGFLPLDRVDTALVAALDNRTLARRGIGPLRHRESPGVEGGYVANGCIECDALIGRFHLEDLLSDHRMSKRLNSWLARAFVARGAVRVVGISRWTRAMFARWMFEDEPRAIFLTPKRWHRKFLRRPGPYQ